MFLMLRSINWPFHCLIAFTSRDIVQYVYYNCLLTRLIFLIKSFWYMTKRSRQTLKYFDNEKSFWGGIKSIFHHFWRAFSCQKLSQTWECDHVIVTSWILKLIISLKSSRFLTWSKNQDKNSNNFRTKRIFQVKYKAFFIIL